MFSAEAHDPGAGGDADEALRDEQVVGGRHREELGETSTSPSITASTTEGAPFTEISVRARGQPSIGERIEGVSRVGSEASLNAIGAAASGGESDGERHQEEVDGEQDGENREVESGHAREAAADRADDGLGDVVEASLDPVGSGSVTGGDPARDRSREEREGDELEEEEQEG